VWRGRRGRVSGAMRVQRVSSHPPPQRASAVAAAGLPSGQNWVLSLVAPDPQGVSANSTTHRRGSVCGKGDGWSEWERPLPDLASSLSHHPSIPSPHLLHAPRLRRQLKRKRKNLTDLHAQSARDHAHMHMQAHTHTHIQGNTSALHACSPSHLSHVFIPLGGPPAAPATPRWRRARPWPSAEHPGRWTCRRR